MRRTSGRAGHRPRSPHVALWLALSCSWVGMSGTVWSGQLPTRLYNSASGLPIDSALELLIDRDGYLWTDSGGYVARFDGVDFETFGPEAGLDGRPQGLAQTPEGTVWVATSAGLRYIAPRGMPAVRAPATDSPVVREEIADICTLPSGELVVPAASGAYLVNGPPEHPGARLLSPLPWGTRVFTVDCDRTGTIWLSQRGGIVTRIAPDGTRTSFPLQDDRAVADPRGVHRDRHGHLWISTWDGLCLGDADAPAGEQLCQRRIREIAGEPVRLTTEIIETGDGAILIAASAGLIRIEPQAALDGALDATWIRAANGLSAAELHSVRTDHGGNLWVSDGRQGLWHVRIGGVVSFAGGELPHLARVDSLQRLPDGSLLAVGDRLDAASERRVIQGWNGRSWLEMPFPRPPGKRHEGWGYHQIAATDARGALWFGSGHGLLGYRPHTSLSHLAFDRPDIIVTSADGLPSGEVFRVFADHRGILFLSVIERVDSRAVQFDPVARTVAPIPVEHWPFPWNPVPHAFTEDRRGGVWFCAHQGIARPGPTGKWEYIPIDFQPGTLNRSVNDLVFDQQQTLWVATESGVYRSLAPWAPAPAFTRAWPITSAPDRRVEALILAEGDQILAASDVGVLAFDHDGRLLRQYGQRTGLPSTLSLALATDATGAVWVGTERGSATLPRGAAATEVVPDPLLVRVSTPLRELTLDRRGQSSLDGLALGPQERSLDIYVRSIQTDTDRGILYSTLLESVDRDWSRPSAQRLLRIAGLSAGRYVLRIRAQDETGATSAREARVEFSVRAPFYERPWFFLALVGSIAFAALSWQRQRAERRLAIERTRTAIATDLHDEVGSGLSRIAVLSEKLARRHQGTAAGDSPADDSREHIAEIARRLVDRMSDLVWAINPERDRVFSLAQRMRQFATPLLRARGIALELKSISEAQDRALAGDTRRELLLAFQELVNNAVKHSGCTRVEVELALRGEWIVLRVSDDGAGFEAGARVEGTGLSSVRQRAKRLGGSCRIDTESGRGATVEILAPVRPRR